jgi:glycosyltransferase involved in cell wall biosynthesis
MTDSPAAPIVSIVVAFYNAERYLREAIESIVAQTFSDFEFVIVDDGSRDGSLAILRAYEARDQRFKIISRPNKGLTVSLNEALGVCRGEFIARMDADDVAAPERFAKQIAFLRSHPDVVVVGGSVELIDPYGVHIGIVNYPPDHEEIDKRLLTGEGGVLPHPATMLRTAAVRQVGNYREQYNNSEDLDLWLRLAEIGRVANLPEVVLKYRRDLGSVSHTKRDNQIRMKGQILGEAFDRRGLTKPDKWVFDTWMPKPKDEQLKEWGWRALRLGRKDAARGHAKALLKLKPRSMSSWKLAFCALRGR